MRVRTAEGSDGAIIRKLYRSSVISIIAAAVAAMLGIVIDGVIIGKYLGTDSMAAYGLVTPLFNFTTAVSGILATGSQVLCAKHLGSGRIDRAKQVFSMCLMIAVVVSVLQTAGILLFNEPVCALIGARGAAANLMPYTRDYLSGMSFGILPVTLLFVFNSLMRLDGDPNRVVAAVAVMTVFDIAGDLLVALVLHAGMLGMGISTTVSYFAAMAVMLGHFRKPEAIFKLTFRDLERKDAAGIGRIGAPTAAGALAAMVRNMILNFVAVGTGKSAAVAALSVRATMNSLFGSVILGIGMTTTMIAGMLFGEEDRTSLAHLVRETVRWSAGGGILLCVIVYAGAGPLAGLFASGQSDSAAMTAYAVDALRLYAIGLPFYGINMGFVSYLQGISDAKRSNILTVLDNLVYAAILAPLLAPLTGVSSVWITYPAAEILVTATLFVWVGVREKKLPKRAEDYLFLPKDFGVSPADTYEKSIRTMDGLMDAVAELSDFMRRKGADERRRLLIPLSVEEMGKNVIEHGFTKDSKIHSIDLRVTRKDESWTVRMRDNCGAFDPNAWMEMHAPKDPAKNVGIRLVTGMAGDVQYVGAMQLNSLIIKV